MTYRCRWYLAGLQRWWDNRGLCSPRESDESNQNEGGEYHGCTGDFLENLRSWAVGVVKKGSWRNSKWSNSNIWLEKPFYLRFLVPKWQFRKTLGSSVIHREASCNAPCRGLLFPSNWARTLGERWVKSMHFGGGGDRASQLRAETRILETTCEISLGRWYKF